MLKRQNVGAGDHIAEPKGSTLRVQDSRRVVPFEVSATGQGLTGRASRYLVTETAKVIAGPSVHQHRDHQEAP